MRKRSHKTFFLRFIRVRRKIFKLFVTAANAASRRVLYKEPGYHAVLSLKGKPVCALKIDQSWYGVLDNLRRELGTDTIEHSQIKALIDMATMPVCPKEGFIRRSILGKRFNKEDLVDHETSAGVFRMNDTYLIQDHVKHDMLTFPIGKCKNGEVPSEGLCTEMREELGIDVAAAKLVCDFTKVYDFTGKPVNIHTFVFDVLSYQGTITNKEPEKCRELRWMTRAEIEQAARDGRRIAHCVTAYFNHLDGKDVNESITD